MHNVSIFDCFRQNYSTADVSRDKPLTYQAGANPGKPVISCAEMKQGKNRRKKREKRKEVEGKKRTKGK